MLGIIANPSSGKDIRRLVAQGTVFDNMEKVNIIQRILSVLNYAGVKEICYMQDSYQIVDRAVTYLERNFKINLRIKELEIKYRYEQNDSLLAASSLLQMGASCIVTLGGDGTNRVVAKGCGDTPLIPLSTGTNNVFPVMLEGSVAGFAAAVADIDKKHEYLKLKQKKRLNIYKNGVLVDIALIDAVITEERFIGSRALWEPETIKEIFVTVAKPDSIGMSAIAGSIYPISEDEQKGLYVWLGNNGNVETNAAIAPGLIQNIKIEGYSEIGLEQKVNIKTKTGIVALDGEREITFGKNDKVVIGLSNDGPKVVDVGGTLVAAAKEGYFKGRWR